MKVNVALQLTPVRNDAPADAVLAELKGVLSGQDFLRVEVDTEEVEEAYLIEVVQIELIEEDK